MKPLNVYRSSPMDDLGLIHFDLAGLDEALFSPIHPAALQYVDAALPSAQAGARWVGLGAPVQENETKAAETPAPVDQAVQSVSEGQAPGGQDQDLQAPQNGIHLTPDFTPADPDFSLQWHLNNTLPGQFDLNILDVWDDYTGSGVQVTIIADGFDLTHEDLDANWLVSLDYDYQGSSNDPTGDPATDLKGTAIAGIIGAEQGNGAGGVGVAFGAKMVGYKGAPTQSYAADMILDAAGLGDGAGNTKGDADGSDIINISVTTVINFDPWLATPDRMAALETVSAEGRDGLGAILVAANGDQRGGVEGTTSAWNSSKYTISVAAVRADGWVTDYSTQGANLLVSAFADTTDNFGGIYTTDRSGEVGYSDGDYAPAFDGTAAAGAQISGVVALMLEANPDLGWRHVQDILAYSARHVGSNVGSTAANFEEGTQTNGASWFFNAATNWNGGGLHFSNDYGFGLVDAKAAVRLAETWNKQSTSANDIELSYDVDGDGAPVVIDNDTLTLDFVVADNIRLEHVSVRLDFASNFPDDVELFLESPNGTRIQLVADEGGGTDFDGVWSFGATGFRGELSAGEWTVIIVDDAGADPTTIRDVKLDLSGAAVSDDDLFIFTDEYSNYGGITHSLIHDGGAAGIDTINAAAVSSASDIDLQAGIGVIDFVLVTVSDIENVYTGDGDDQVKGDGGDNLISGGRGDDLLNGRGGDDILMGGLGADTLHGNNGSDTASYADATSAVTVRLYDGFTAGVYAAGDLLISIENLTGSDHHDTLYGDSGANTLDGGAGNDFLQAGRGDDVVRGGAGKDTLYGHDGADLLEGGNQADDLYGGDDNDILRGGFGVDSLYGEAGDDTLDGGVAADTLDGGAGRDTASYASSSAGVTVRLYDGFADGGDAEGDTLISIENLTGSDHDDILYGDSGANTLEGGAGDDFLNAGRGNDVVRGGDGQDALYGHDGNDFLDGGAQADQLYGGDGNDALRGGFGGDSLYGQAGDDTLDGGAWSDTLDGGAGRDTASYANSSAGVTARLYDGFTAGGDAEGDTLISIENLTGSDHDDILYGDSGANTLEGGAGDDFLNAGRGDDIVLGGVGQDALYGHDGNDFLDGGAQADQLYGGDGNDALRGGFGGDSLFGQAGDDTLDGGAWSDTLDGGAGRDTASYANSSAGVTARLYDGFTAGGDAEGDTLISIENLTGSDHDDILYGDSGANTLEGGAGDDLLNAGRGNDVIRGGAGQDVLAGHDGNDFLDGGAQADQLYGGDGNDALRGGFGGDSLFGQAGDDTLDGGAWSDTLDGGAGDDTAIYANSTAGVTVRLYDGFADGGDASGDTLISIENLTGSNHDDILYGDSGANTLEGGAGDDFLNAGRGNDVVRGGDGQDALYGHDGNDFLDGGAQADQLYGGDGNDALRGGFGGDSLFGQAGDDTLDGGAWSDTLDGGAGRDTASYANSSAGVTARLYDGFTAGGDAEGDTLISIENLTGSDHDDILYGDSRANTLEGGAGDDFLNAGRGDDIVLGGVGQDALYGHDGNDFLDGGAQADQLYGGDGNDTLIGGFGGDSLFGQAGDDTLEGGGWSDTLDGGAGFDRAIFSGLQSDYAFSTDAITGELIVEDLRPGSPDGTDRLTDIEELEFGDGSVVAVGALGGASELSVSSLEAGFIYQPSEGAASPTALGQPVKAEPFSWADYDAINPAQFGVSKIIEAEVFEVWAGDGDAVVYEAAHQPVPVSAPEAMDPVILGSLHGDPALRFSDTLDLSVHNAPNVLNGVDRGDGLLRVDVLDDVWAS